MLTAKQVGPLLGLSARKVYELARSGALTHYRFGRAVRFDTGDVKAYHLSKEPIPLRTVNDLTPRERRVYEKLLRAAAMDT